MLTLTATFGSATVSLTDINADGFLVDGDQVRWGDFAYTDRFKQWLARGKSRESYPYGEWFNPATHTFPVKAKSPVADLDAVMRRARERGFDRAAVIGTFTGGEGTVSAG